VRKPEGAILAMPMWYAYHIGVGRIVIITFFVPARLLYIYNGLAE
jgi:hypothetical protein